MCLFSQVNYIELFGQSLCFAQIVLVMCLFFSTKSFMFYVLNFFEKKAFMCIIGHVLIKNECNCKRAKYRIFPYNFSEKKVTVFKISHAMKILTNSIVRTFEKIVIFPLKLHLWPVLIKAQFPILAFTRHAKSYKFPVSCYGIFKKARGIPTHVWNLANKYPDFFGVCGVVRGGGRRWMFVVRL